MFLGKATVMTDIGGNRGLAIDGKTALVVPPRNEEAMAKAITSLVEDEDFRSRIGAGGREYMMTHYRSVDTAKDLDAAYRQVLSAAPSK